MIVTYNDVLYCGYGSRISINEPSECPICKHSLKPSVLSKEIIKNNNSTPFFYVSYLCTHCYGSFICKFSNMDKTDAHCFTFKDLDMIAPNSFDEKIFDQCINTVSPSFVKIYNQALEAEHHNLDEIAGIGYRKALEFLIKDFLIQHEQISETKVKSTALGNCINTMIENPQLRTVASRATWLGNDQTHYEQKYTDKDITDLKRLIDLSVHWISMICLTEESELIEKK